MGPLGLLGLLALAGVLWVVYKLTQRPAGNIPPLVPGKPLIGNAVEFGTDPVNTFRNAYNALGGCFTMKVFHEHLIFFVGPEAQQFFFTTDEDTFNAAAAYKFTVPIFGKGVVYDGPPELLIEQRKMISHGLSKKRFLEYIPLIERECQMYFERRWGDAGEADLMQTFNECTVLTSTMCLQGPEIRHMADEFVKLYWTLDEALDAVAFFFPNLPVPRNWARDKARARMDEIFQRVIDNRRKAGEKEYSDLVSTLMESKFPDGTPLSDKQIIGMMVGLLLAGQHTSNVTAAWLGVELLDNSEWKAKCVAEQEKVVGDDVLDFKKLQQCEQLNLCLKESLRLHPPLMCLMRRVVSDTTYKGYDIPKGTLVAVSPNVSMRLPEVYADPDTFDPTRFLPPRSEDKQKFSYLAFGSGRHACIGEKFANLQVATIWGYLLRHYDIEQVGKKAEPNYTTMVVGPQPPVKVSYKRKAKK